MRIAISGSHCTGKSTLIARLADALPGHTVVEEPYYALEAAGHAFGHPPSLEDFLAQLEHSIASIAAASPDALFDRCPADFLAYALARGGSDALGAGAWLPRARESLRLLDVVVYVPIETRDRMAGAGADEPRLRKRVDVILREILLDDALGLGLDALEVAGTPGERAAQVLEHVRQGR
jgi:predicted ATPase